MNTLNLFQSNSFLRNHDASRPLLAGLLLAVMIGAGVPAHAAPPNDNFTNRITLSGANVTTTGTNINATVEPGEPNHGAPWGKTGGKSIWWTWTAPCAGYVTVTDIANFNHLLAVYTGSALTNLVWVGGDYDSSGYGTYASFDVTPGAIYQIAVDGQSGASGTNTLTLSLQPPPANDNFTNAIALTGASVTTSGSNVAATKEPGEPNHNGTVGGRSVWWSWTAPVGGRVTVSASGSLSKVVAVYTGSSVARLTAVAGAAASFSYPATATFDAVAATVYQIAVDGSTTNDFTSNITLQIALQLPPANDNFANATAITGTKVLVSASNISATKEPGEPNHAGYAGGRSVWWTWTAPLSGHYAVVLSGPFNVLLGIYTGTSVSALTTVASAYAITNANARATFSAVAGATYEIAVDGENAVSDYFNFALTLPPLNDDFANAFTLANTNQAINASNIGATKEPGEPAHGGDDGGASVWWTWTAPASGRVVISATPISGLTPTIGVYTGNAVSNLVTIASGVGWSTTASAYAVFDTIAGTAYAIAVDGQYGEKGMFSLMAQFVTAPPNDNFARRLPLTNTANNVWYVTGSDFGATEEPGETAGGTASVWWTWTAPTNGEALIEFESLGYPGAIQFPWLEVSTGSTISNLTRVYARVEFAGDQTYDDGRFPVTAGTTYQICAATRTSGPGNYFLRLTFEPPPPNDNFANRITITNTDFLFQYGYLYMNGYNVSATKETGEPLHGGPSFPYGGKSVWWTWTAPGSGTASVGVNPIRYTFSSMVGVYTGTAVNALTRTTNCYSTCTSGACGVAFPITAGTTYQIAADGGGSYGDSGEFTLELDISIDTNAPTVAITAPTNGQTVAASALTVIGTASDPKGPGSASFSSGVKLVEVRLNGGAWLAATGTNNWSQNLTLASGNNLIEARARDAAGNYSSLAAASVMFGNSITSVQITGSVAQIGFLSTIGKTYTLECASNLIPRVTWAPVAGASAAGTGALMTLSETNCAAHPQRFYRVRVDN